MSAVWVGSPNYTAGRGGQKVEKIVVHWMAGTLASTDMVFQDKTRKTSAHYGVEDGVAHQYVHEADTAWHSGDGATNQRTIGIEHSAQPGRNASEATYQTSAQLIAEIAQRHDLPINSSTVVPHNSIVATQCPGTIDLNKLIAQANNQGISDVIPDSIHLQVIFQQLWGRDPLPEEYERFVGKAGYTEVIDTLTSQQAYRDTQTALSTGQVAVRDNWQGQIEHLTSLVATGDGAIELGPGTYVVKQGSK